MKKILCPVDFSPVANNAIEYAAMLAQKINAEITLFHMQSIPLVDVDYVKPNVFDGLHEETKELEMKLDGYAQEISSTFNIKCHTEVELSNIISEIAVVAEERNFDLLVVGTSGEDSLYDSVFGSNTYNMMRKTTCPMLIIPSNVAYKNYNKVVYASNYEKGDIVSLIQFKKLFKNYNPIIEILHISSHGTSRSVEIFEWFQDMVSEKLENKFNLNFVRKVEDNIPEAIDEHMIREGADLLAICTKNRNFFQKLFHKSISRMISKIADYPVLVFHE